MQQLFELALRPGVPMHVSLTPRSEPVRGIFRNKIDKIPVHLERPRDRSSRGSCGFGVTFLEILHCAGQPSLAENTN